MKINIMDEKECPQNEHIVSAFLVTQEKLERYNYGNIMVSVSGGADSDIMIDIVEKCRPKGSKIHYVFFDTGLEYEATKNHLNFLEEKYDIIIERIKPQTPIPIAVKKYGVPWKNKEVAELIDRAQRHDFKFELNEEYESLSSKYPKMQHVLKWWTNNYGTNSRYNIEKTKGLKEFLSKYPPSFSISQKCCKYAKKDLAKKYKKDNNIVLSLVGIRKSEGGQRSTTYKNCFTPAGDKNDIAEYRPLFWMTNQDKKDYEKFYSIEHSDCYKVYGLKRTGCAGCPFGRDYEGELEIIKKYEPKLYKACLNIFGQSYEYYNTYLNFRDKI